jgi:hypothetical protein
VCVDFAPDFPDGLAAGWRCGYEEDAGIRRNCVRDPAAHQLGDWCEPNNPCSDGSRCVASICVPEKPAPSCAVDGDCPSKACRFGTCFGAAP